MAKHSTYSKSISLVAGNVNNEVFLDTVYLFAKINNITDSKLIIDTIINHYFPDWLICRPHILDSLKNKTDASVSNLIGGFMLTVNHYPEAIRLKSVGLLRCLTDYHIYAEENEKDGELVISIENRLGYLLAVTETDRNNEKRKYDANQLDKIIHDLSKLRDEWNSDKYLLMTFTDLISCFISDWDYFNHDVITGSIINQGLKLFNIRYSDDLFYKIYKIFYAVSEENRMLDKAGW